VARRVTRVRSPLPQKTAPIFPLCARQLTADDFARFNLILCADCDNLAVLRALRRHHSVAQCDLLLRHVAHAGALDVPDPYSGDSSQFCAVFSLLCDAMDALRQWPIDHNPGSSATMQR